MFRAGAVVVVLGGDGQFYALLGEVYVGWRGCVCIDGADKGCEKVEMLNSRGGL